MSCSVICLSLKHIELVLAIGLSMRCDLYFKPLSRLCEDRLFSFLSFWDSIDTDIEFILYRFLDFKQSFKNADRTEIDAIDFVWHHCYHLSCQFNFLLENGSELQGYVLLNVGNYLLIELPWLLQEFNSFFSIAAHEFRVCLCNVDFRVDETSIIMVVFS
jgi:hypothetical protein